LGTFDNNAKSCYDRIIPALAMLRSRQLGLPRAASHLHGRFLATARYHIKTALGTSKEYYSHTTEQPIYGTGQGSKPSPVMWLGQSTAIMDLMGTHKLVMIDPRNTIQIQRQTDGYVDDATGWTNAIQQLQNDTRAVDQSASLTLTQLQDVAQRWEALLTSTGGQLELSKCFYYLVQWQFDKHGVPTMSKTVDSNLQVRDSSTGQQISITQQSPTTPHRTLGVYLAPSGTMQLAMEKLRAKAGAFAIRTRSARLLPGDAEVACRLMYQPSMGYMLPATTLTESNLRSIQYPAIAAFTAAMGYNRNMPAAVLHGPRRFGGLGLPDLYIEQGAEHIQFLLRHVRQHTIVGRTARLLIDWYQLYSGQIAPLMESVTIPTELYVPGEWINSSRQYLRDADQHIRLLDPYTATLRRVNDRCLMYDALKWTQQPQLLNDVNNCRMYLRVDTLADITNAEGHALLHRTVHADRDTNDNSERTAYRTNLLWPRQPRPGSRAWATWRKFLQTTYSYTHHTLQTPLGEWHDAHRHRVWCLTYDVLNDEVRVQRTDGWTSHAILHRQRRQWILDPNASTQGSDTTYPPLTTSIPTHWVTQLPDDFRCAIPHVPSPELADSDNDSNSPNPADDPLSSFRLALEDLPAWTQLYTCNIQLRRDAHQVFALALQHGETIHASIGSSLQGAKAAYGWTLGTRTMICYTGYGPVTGQPLQLHRIAISGNIALLFTLSILIAELQLTVHPTTTVLLHVDNDTLLKFPEQQHLTMKDPTHPDWDVRVLLRNVLRELDLPVRYRFTRNQHGNTALHHTQAQTLANDATKHYCQYFAHVPTTQPTKWNPIGLHNFGGCITSFEGNFLRDAVRERDYIAYLTGNRGWTQPHIDGVDWDSRHAALTTILPTVFRYVVKASHGWLPTQTHQHKMDPRNLDVCALCGQRETQAHIFRCPAQASWRRSLLTTTAAILHRHTTPAALQGSILYCLGSWLRGETPDPRYKGNGDVTYGWERVLYGYIPTSWSTQQAGNPKCIPATRGNPWARVLIAHFVDSSHRAWLSRCDLIHNTQTPGTVSSSTQALHHKIRGLCSDRHLLLAYDRSFFELDLDRLFARSSERRLRSWYATARQFYNDAFGRAQTQTTLGVRGIRYYFQQQQPTPPTVTTT
jgi:hypothetical protein